jgi:hypothetical protein
MLGRGDEFKQRFSVIGGDLRVRQCRAQCDRVRGACQPALAVDAQSFAFDAAQALAKQWPVRFIVEQGKTARQLVGHGWILSCAAE